VYSFHPCCPNRERFIDNHWQHRTTSHTWNENDERQFTAMLEKELDKIHEFQKAKVNDLFRQVTAEFSFVTLFSRLQSFPGAYATLRKTCNDW
jgi:SPX domain protein involved in polyphosphate accumulation